LNIFDKIVSLRERKPMPLVKIEKTGDQSGWGLWLIDETEEQFSTQIDEMPEQDIIYPNKRLEWFAARLLLKNLVQQFNHTYSGTWKNEFGKPLLKLLPHHISLSHSYPFVAAQIDLTHEVGIDLEQPKPKLLTIAHRILSEDELTNAGENITKHCIYWCAKEAMYKAYGKRGLHFSSQLLVNPFEMRLQGELTGHILARNCKREMKLNYQVNTDFVIVTTNTEIL
jgi:phosphopantetheinyl transferase